MQTTKTTFVMELKELMKKYKVNTVTLLKLASVLRMQKVSEALRKAK